MKASELRIGNWIADRGRKEWQIDHWETRDKVASKAPTIMCMGILQEAHSLTEYVDYLYPIPLTEEWLLKFGFEPTRFQKEPHQWWNNGKIEIGHTTKDDVMQYEYLSPTNTEMVDIPYVHQLQNLYFALTGEELEMKSINTQNK